MRRIVFILVALIFSFSIAACGQKGALKLPQDPPVPTPKTSAPGVDK
jgi:predicted small lipoprotein YifL